MRSDFDNVLDGLCGMISDFNFNCFTCMDTVPSKAQMF